MKRTHTQQLHVPGCHGSGNATYFKTGKNRDFDRLRSYCYKDQGGSGGFAGDCAAEEGACGDASGKLVASGMFANHRDDGPVAQERFKDEYECLRFCRSFEGATGCEIVGTGGYAEGARCYVHTASSLAGGFKG